MPVTYTYDNLPNAKGKLTKVTNGFSTTEYTEFDVLGRVKQSKQTTDGVVYNPMSYVYNLSGALIEQKYPSGRVVKNVLDADGDLSLVQSKKNVNFSYQTYAQNFTYTAAGAVSSMQFGNADNTGIDNLGNGLWESTVFNSRLQPTQIGLGTVNNATDKLKLEYNYGGTTNNGNVQSQIITVPTVGQTPGFVATQTYTYDSLNRLKSAEETILNQTGWKQIFLYDRYGNRNFDEANTTTLPKNCGTAPNLTVCAADVPLVNPTVNTQNNRLNGYQFDNAGNTKVDAASKTFTYDGENKQTKVMNGAVTIGEYFYDGDGKRVKKVVPSTGETTIFIYDASGRMVAEYSTIVATHADAKVSYLTSDHLGSPRINTDQNGQVTARHDYHPFGEEIPRASYSADTVRKKFTLYERDIESSLDFAEARMYGYNHGRFTSPDPYNIILESQAEIDKEKAQRKLVAYLGKPQQWNRYPYVANNPLSYIDPTGELLELTGTQAEKDRSLQRLRELLGKDADIGIITINGHTYVQARGNLREAAGDVGQVIQDIIRSERTTVEFQVTSKDTVTNASGENIDLKERLAVTEIIDSTKVQIFIKDNSADTLTFKARNEWAEDWGSLKFTNSVMDAHEFGHAWGAVVDRTFENRNKSKNDMNVADNLNKTRSLQVENWQRNRLGLSRRTSHP